MEGSYPTNGTGCMMGWGIHVDVRLTYSISPTSIGADHRHTFPTTRLSIFPNVCKLSVNVSVLLLIPSNISNLTWSQINKAYGIGVIMLWSETAHYLQWSVTIGNPLPWRPRQTDPGGKDYPTEAAILHILTVCLYSCTFSQLQRFEELQATSHHCWWTYFWGFTERSQ